MGLHEHAERELREAGLFDADSDYGGMLGSAVLELVDKFAAQGHSGFSAGVTIDLFRRVANYETLTPMKNPTLTGEYIDHGDKGPKGYHCWQSTRDSAVFSEDCGKTWYHLDKYRTRWQRLLVRIHYALPGSLGLPKQWMRGRMKFQ